MIVESNNAFDFASMGYSDASCTTQTADNTQFAGTLIIGTERVLDDGSTGNPVDMTVTSPASDALYTIFQLDTADSNILRMGDFYSAASIRDANNFATDLFEFSRVL